MRRVAVLVVALAVAVALAGCGRPAPGPQSGDAAEIPREYRALYTDLEGRLARFEASLGAAGRRGARVVFGAELLTANTHRGEELLKPASYQGHLLFMDRLQALGVQGVTFSVAYPVLSADFPRADQYLAFYRRLAGDVRARGLKLAVKSGILFPQKEFGNVAVDYSRVTVDQYLKEKARHIGLILRELRPDYLTIGAEPTTEGQILGKPIGLDRYTTFIEETLATLGSHRTAICAGSGSWDKIDFVARYARIPALDCIDLHIYPLGSPFADFLQAAARMADTATEHRKRLIISEVWLYKAAGRELLQGGIASTPRIFARDTFSFWEPLDQKMLRVIARLARAKGIEYVSPFWTKYLIAYLEYDRSTRGRSPQGLLRQADAEMVKNLMANRFTGTGLAYRGIIQGTD